MKLINQHCLLISLFTSIVFMSCKKENNTATQATYQLVQQADKVFPLDDDTAYNRIENTQIVEVNNTSYFTFFNRESYSLYFYDYTSGNLNHQVQLNKEGPNGIVSPYYTFQYIVHDLNTVIINTHKFLYIVDRDGNVIKKIETDITDITREQCIEFNSATYFNDNKLYSSLNTVIPKKEDLNVLRGVFNFETEAVEDTYFEERVMVKDQDKIIDRLTNMYESSGALFFLPKFFVGNDEALYASYGINDSIYEYRNKTLYKIHYAGDPNITIADYKGFFNKAESKIPGVETGRDFNESTCAYYTNMMMGPNKQWIYRILIHGTETVINPETNFPQTKVIGASLIVFNTETQMSSVFKIPLDEVYLPDYPSNIFVTEKGIHFPVKDQDNENEKQYKVFKLE